MKTATVTPEKALANAMKLCARQERSHHEIRMKLQVWRIGSADAEKIIAELIALDFLNEDRFARAFARGKFRILGWGKNKIKKGLAFHRISEKCIEKGLSEIDEKVYRQALMSLVRKKKQEYAGEEESMMLKKLSQFLYLRGFEAELIKEILFDGNTMDA
ncbi:MAG: regulatory protein RecX [Bacteroidota bacterium]